MPMIDRAGAPAALALGGSQQLPQQQPAVQAQPPAADPSGMGTPGTPQAMRPMPQPGSAMPPMTADDLNKLLPFAMLSMGGPAANLGSRLPEYMRPHMQGADAQVAHNLDNIAKSGTAEGILPVGQKAVMQPYKWQSYLPKGKAIGDGLNDGAHTYYHILDKVTHKEIAQAYTRLSDNGAMDLTISNNETGLQASAESRGMLGVDGLRDLIGHMLNEYESRGKPVDRVTAFTINTKHTVDLPAARIKEAFKAAWQGRYGIAAAMPALKLIDNAAQPQEPAR